MNRVWWAQIKAVVRLEMKKTFFAKRGLWIYVVAALPVLLFVAYVVATSQRQHQTEDIARKSERLLTYQDLEVVQPGMTSQEVVAILGKPPITYHWTENRQPESENDAAVEVLHEDYRYSDGQNDLFVGVANGKVLAGLLATSAIFVTSELLQTVAFLWHFPPNVRDVYLYHNHGLEHAAVYLGVTVLACVGYGAFFLVAGMLFRNPILPAAAILIWEAINPFLPGMLKQFSVIYYLKALCPVDIPIPPGTPPVLALLISNSDPVSAPVAVVGIVIVAMIALYASSVQVRRMEINYTTE